MLAFSHDITVSTQFTVGIQFMSHSYNSHTLIMLTVYIYIRSLMSSSPCTYDKF